MQFRRRLTIKSIETMWPLAVMLLVTISILIAWTVVDPWHWERRFVSFDPPTTYGQCESDNFLAWVIPLCSIMIGSIVLAVFAAWRTKHIANNFSDTSSVFYSIALQAQAWLVGVPTLALLAEEYPATDARYFGSIILITVVSGSPLLLVLGPRIWIALRIRRPSSPQRKVNLVRLFFTSGFLGFYNSAFSSTPLSCLTAAEKNKSPPYCLPADGGDDDEQCGSIPSSSNMTGEENNIPRYRLPTRADSDDDESKCGSIPSEVELVA